MKIPRRYAHLLYITLLSLLMSVLMTLALTVLRFGFALGWMSEWVRSGLSGFPVALVASFIVVPTVHYFVAHVTDESS